MHTNVVVILAFQRLELLQKSRVALLSGANDCYIT